MEGGSEKPIEIADPFARKLMARYLERRDADLDNLRNALELSDFDAIRRTGHNLFGSGSAYGLEDISSYGQRIESAATERDASEIASVIGELEHFLRNLIVA